MTLGLLLPLLFLGPTLLRDDGFDVYFGVNRGNRTPAPPGGNGNTPAPPPTTAPPDSERSATNPPRRGRRSLPSNFIGDDSYHEGSEVPLYQRGGRFRRHNADSGDDAKKVNSQMPDTTSAPSETKTSASTTSQAHSTVFHKSVNDSSYEKSVKTDFVGTSAVPQPVEKNSKPEEATFGRDHTSKATEAIVPNKSDDSAESSAKSEIADSKKLDPRANGTPDTAEQQQESDQRGNEDKDKKASHLIPSSSSSTDDHILYTTRTKPAVVIHKASSRKATTKEKSEITASKHSQVNEDTTPLGDRVSDQKPNMDSTGKISASSPHLSTATTDLPTEVADLSDKSSGGNLTTTVSPLHQSAGKVEEKDVTDAPSIDDASEGETLTNGKDNSAEATSVDSVTTQNSSSEEVAPINDDDDDDDEGKEIDDIDTSGSMIIESQTLSKHKYGYGEMKSRHQDVPSAFLPPYRASAFRTKRELGAEKEKWEGVPILIRLLILNHTQDEINPTDDQQLNFSHDENVRNSSIDPNFIKKLPAAAFPLLYAMATREFLEKGVKYPGNYIQRQSEDPDLMPSEDLTKIPSPKENADAANKLLDILEKCNADFSLSMRNQISTANGNFTNYLYNIFEASRKCFEEIKSSGVLSNVGSDLPRYLAEYYVNSADLKGRHGSESSQMILSADGSNDAENQPSRSIFSKLNFQRNILEVLRSFLSTAAEGGRTRLLTLLNRNAEATRPLSRNRRSSDMGEETGPSGGPLEIIENYPDSSFEVIDNYPDEEDYILTSEDDATDNSNTGSTPMRVKSHSVDASYTRTSSFNVSSVETESIVSPDDDEYADASNPEDKNQSPLEKTYTEDPVSENLPTGSLTSTEKGKNASLNTESRSLTSSKVETSDADGLKGVSKSTHDNSNGLPHSSSSETKATDSSSSRSTYGGENSKNVPRNDPRKEDWNSKRKSTEHFKAQDQSPDKLKPQSKSAMVYVIQDEEEADIRKFSSNKSSSENASQGTTKIEATAEPSVFGDTSSLHHKDGPFSAKTTYGDSSSDGGASSAITKATYGVSSQQKKTGTGGQSLPGRVTTENTSSSSTSSTEKSPNAGLQSITTEPSYTEF